MPLSEYAGELSRLGEQLSNWLPGAALSASRPALVPELELWLLHDTLAKHPLDPVTINRLMEDPPYWCFCWASGQVLARWVLDHPEAVRGRKVVDLGSGSAVVALAAARAGADRVVACDLDPRASSAARINARHNGLALETVATLEECPGRTDVFLAADVLYDRENLPLLEAMRRQADRVVLADSRIKGLDPPGYTLFDRRTATTWPDLGEAGEYNDVRLFCSDVLVRKTPGGEEGPIGRIKGGVIR